MNMYFFRSSLLISILTVNVLADKIGKPFVQLGYSDRIGAAGFTPDGNFLLSAA